MGIKTGVSIGKITLKNPVTVASGTFGTGEEYADLMDINRLGAIVTKTITLNARKGNPPPRIIETASGMLNSIGLENNGLDYFIKHKLQFLNTLRTQVIVSVGGESAGEIIEISRRLNDHGIKAFELNISCPNVKGPRGRARGYDLISQCPKDTFRAVKSIRKITRATLITKLSPNVTDVAEIALAAEEAGSDAVSLVNTFLGMAVDIKTLRPRLGAVTGGLSGPAIKPIALRMVRDTHNKVKIPIIGIGGIMDYRDALEFMICGATAVQVGTANFVNPRVTIEIIDGINKYLAEKKIGNINRLIGALKYG